MMWRYNTFQFTCARQCEGTIPFSLPVLVNDTFQFTCARHRQWYLSVYLCLSIMWRYDTFQFTCARQCEGTIPFSLPVLVNDVKVRYLSVYLCSSLIPFSLPVLVNDVKVWYLSVYLLSSLLKMNFCNLICEYNGWLHFLDYLSLRPKTETKIRSETEDQRKVKWIFSFGLRPKLIRTFHITAYWFYMEEIR